MIKINFDAVFILYLNDFNASVKANNFLNHMCDRIFYQKDNFFNALERIESEEEKERIYVLR